MPCVPPTATSLPGWRDEDNVEIEAKSNHAVPIPISTHPVSSHEIPPPSIHNVLSGQTVQGVTNGNSIELVPMDFTKMIHKMKKEARYNISINIYAFLSSLLLYTAIALYMVVPFISAWMNLSYQQTKDESYIPSEQVVFGIAGSFASLISASAAFMFISSHIDGNIVDNVINRHTSIVTLAQDHPSNLFTDMKELKSPYKNSFISRSFLVFAIIFFFPGYDFIRSDYGGMGITCLTASAMCAYIGFAVSTMTSRMLGRAAISICQRDMNNILNTIEFYEKTHESEHRFEKLKKKVENVSADINGFKQKMTNLNRFTPVITSDT